MKVLLLDGDTVQAISVLKSLKEMGASVTVFCENRISYGYTSRYPDKKIISPVIKENENAFVDFLIDFLSREPHDVIIPLYNESAETLSKHKDKVGETAAKCAIQEYDLFMKAHDKESLMDICKHNEIPHPRTADPMKLGFEQAVKYVGFPMLVKPNISSGSHGIIYVDEKDDLRRAYESLQTEYGRFTFQEYIHHSGIYYNAMMFRTKTGNFLNTVVIQIMRYFPVRGGTSSFCLTIDNPDIVTLCEKLLDALDWYGFADIDILQDKLTNEYKVIEINPRIPSSIKAAAIAGVNYPEMIVRDILGLQLQEYPYHLAKKLRYLAMDILWFIFSRRRFSSTPSWFQFFGRDLYYQDGSLDDPLPMFAGIMMGMKKYLNPAFRKSKLNQKR